jgi:hypothetical protein
MNSKSMRWLAVAAVGTLVASSFAQTTPTPGQEPQSRGQVVFSRSIDENGETQTHSGPAAALPAIQAASQPAAADADRQAVTFTDFDMDVHLQAASQQIAVRALLTVRNDGKNPLQHLPLQISSSLNWERIRLNGHDVAFQVATLNTDVDHTGQLHEAAVPLVRPLPPGSSLQLDISYGGRIAESAQRLLSIGTPEDVARHSDWDRIGIDFTGLRGFGNVVWYPVASVPAMLGDGARLFDEIGAHKLRLGGARFRLRLTDEFPHGQAPSIALINGYPVELTITESGTLDQRQEVASVATAILEGATLGFETPSLFIAIRTPHPATNATIWTLPENNIASVSWAASTLAVTPFLQGWLGQLPNAQLTLLDLPDREDAPFESGSLLATVLREASSEQLNGILAHALTHAYTHHLAHSPPAWLDEGVAHFMGTLWVEKQRGRDQALGALESGRAALALAEPESPGQSAGQPLTVATSPVYYRSKAAYVLWMLRDVAGDEALSAALRAYDPAQETGAGGRSAFEKLLEQASMRPDLRWFFADWVDADKGLPDLTIDGVFPTPAQSGNWLVAVNLSNLGYAAAEVPVTVRSGANTSTQRVLIAGRGKVVQRILIQGKPFEVQVNDGTVPETQTTVHLTKLDQSAPEPAETVAPRIGPH